MVRDTIAYQYAKWCLTEGNYYVGKYVKKQSKKWLDIAEGKNPKAYFDEKEYVKLESILALLVHPDLNCPMSEGLEPYAWFMITAIFCTKLSNAEGKNIRYYESAVLEIARKNFKTFNCAVIFILLMLMEPQFLRFFSVAPDLALSSELKGAIRKIIKSSPYINNHFKVLRSQIRCTLTDSEYTPLAYSKDGMDGKLANAFLADEAGALDDYPVEAMRSSQITLTNKLGIVISTQYPNDDNVMIDEIDCVKKILDGLNGELSDRCFGLLYEPDEELLTDDAWQTNDTIIYQANPVAVSNDKIFDKLKQRRAIAIMYPNKRENFLCKHCNIKFKGMGTEGYIEITSVRECKRKEDLAFWQGKKVYLGLDLSMTEDNTSVAMVTVYENKIYAKVWGWIPEDKKEEKRKREKVDYDKLIRQKVCFESEGATINYLDVQNFIISFQRLNLQKVMIHILQRGIASNLKRQVLAVLLWQTVRAFGRLRKHLRLRQKL